MGDGSDDVGQRGAIVNQPIELVVGLNRHRGHFRTWRDDFLRRRNYFNGRFHHGLAALIDGGAGEQHGPGFRAFLARLGGQGECVIQIHRPQVTERLGHEYGARPRQLTAEQAGEQTGHPHAVADQWRVMFASEFFVQVGGIEVAGHSGEELDIQWFQGAGQADFLTDFDLGEGAIGDGVGVHEAIPPEAGGAGCIFRHSITR